MRYEKLVGWDITIGHNYQNTTRQTAKIWNPMTGEKGSQRLGLSISTKQSRERLQSAETKTGIKPEAVKETALPLLLRGVIVEEIHQITGFSNRQIDYLKSNSREKGRLKSPSKEERNKTRVDSAKYTKRVETQRGYTAIQVNGFTLARALNNAGFFTEDLTAWNALNKLYQEKERPLPEDLADKLRLEAFLKANLSAQKEGDRDLLNRYSTLRSEIYGSLPPTEEEEFIDLALKNEYGKKLQAEPSFAHLLPKPICEYPPDMKQIIGIVSEENTLSPEEQMAFLVFLALYTTEYTTDNMHQAAEMIGITLREAEKYMKMTRLKMTDDQWELLERLSDKLH